MALLFDQVINYNEARDRVLNCIKAAYVVDINFRDACEAYKQDLRPLILSAIAVTINTGNTASINTKLLSESYLINGKNYSRDIIHYGEEKVDNIGTYCNPTTWEEHGVAHPFKEMQKELLAKGYYLQDISENNEFNIIIGGKKKKSKNLWHRLNEIP